jgi:hypothetical protein
MASSSCQRLFKRGEPGFALAEAVVAAAFAATALTVYAVILNKQSELVQRTKDLARIEAIINEDINATRHATRFWQLTKSPYTPDLAKTSYSSMMIYEPKSFCEAWTSRGRMENSFRSDVGLYKDIPGTIAISGSTAVLEKTVPGYVITRTPSSPSPSGSQINNSVTSGEEASYTLRLTYSIKKDDTNKSSQPFSFERTADIQIPAQFFC